VSIEDDAEARRLRVDVHARDWQGSPPQFRFIQDVNGEDVTSSVISLPRIASGPQKMATWVEPSASNGAKQDERADSSSGVTMVEAPMSEDLIARSFRDTVFRFFKLTVSQKAEIMGHLELLDDDDAHLSQVEQGRRSLSRARERGLHKKLDELIDQMESK
jgi:hypothetical protein